LLPRSIKTGKITKDKLSQLNVLLHITKFELFKIKTVFASIICTVTCGAYVDLNIFNQ